MKFFVILVILIPWVASANVVINEIAWMGSPPKAGESASVASNNEWIELYNNESEMADLNGWALNAADGQPSITLSGTIPAGGYFLLERTDDETVSGVAADLIYTGALSNSGEKLELKNAAGTIIDRVDASGGWPAGDNTTKETMQLVLSGVEGRKWITGTGTPRAENAGANAGASREKEAGATPASSNLASSNPAYEQKRFFSVDAGKDIKTVAGAEVHFSGAAFGFDGKLLDDPSTGSGQVRYLWNFGDGAFFEAKNVNHVYRYPGTYRATLYVSSGQTSGSDVIEVVVGESSVAISEVAGVWIELVNEGTAAVDMSSWQIRNGAGQIYTLPAHTIIGPAAFVVFSQETTGLFFGQARPNDHLVGQVNPKAELRYANGTLADALSFGGVLLSEKSIIRDDEGNAMMGEPTPGKENVIFQKETKNPARTHQPARTIRSDGAGGQRSNTKTTKQNLKTSQINPNDQSNTKLNAKPYTLNATSQQASLFSSNYFWLAASISIGLLAGAVVLALRSVVRL